MLFASKQKKIEELLEDYYEHILLCLNDMCRAITEYNESNGNREQLKKNRLVVSTQEGKADDIRREIEVMMYAKALFPESRGDILGLLETIDRVPNQAEWVVSMLLTHHIRIPENFQGKIIELANICQRCVEALIDSAKKLFTDFSNATEAIGRVDELESKSDQLELELLEDIFSSDLGSMDKMLLRDLTLNLASLCDRAENAGDRIRIVVAKRAL